jgi:signal transduction histidine kinase
LPSDDVDALRAELARVTRERSRLARELELAQISARITRDELDTQRLARELARHAAVLLNAERVLVFVCDNDVARARARAQRGKLASELELEGFVYGSSDGITGQVMLRQQTVLSPNAADDARFDLHRQRGMPCRNALCVPVINHQRHVIGVIEAHNRRDGGIFTQDDASAAQMLAMQSATGIERARMFERMHEWAQSLESLLAFNAAINAHLNPQMLVRRLVENAARFLKADGGMAGLAIPQENGEITLVADSYWHLGEWHPYTRTWRSNEGLPGFMLVSEFPYVTNTYTEDQYHDPQLAAQFDVRKVLCVPIKNAQDRVLGFFKLHNSAHGHSFTWQDAGFLESLANMTAVAIENALLIKALEATNAQVQALSAGHLNRLEEERRRISRELHDEAGQALIGVKLALQVMALRVQGDSPELRGELDALREQVNAATTQIKNLARHLRPPTLDELGLSTAIRQLASDLERRGGARIRLDMVEFEPRLPQTFETALYRIAQEALTNIQKHANASQVWLMLGCKDGNALLTVCDDGCGFDAKRVESGLGLLGMRERAEMLGGHVRISGAAGGTRIDVQIPMRDARDEG